jgi:hypothetical protein
MPDTAGITVAMAGIVGLTLSALVTTVGDTPMVASASELAVDPCRPAA